MPSSLSKNQQGNAGFLTVDTVRLPDCQTRADGMTGRRWPGMTAGLAIGTTLAVILATTAGGYFYSVRHSRSLLENARETARTQAELIREGLEYQMLLDDRTLVQQMIETFGRQPNAERVALLDREGKVQFSSGSLPAEDFAPDSPTCQVCHRYPAAERMDSRVLETAGGRVLRTVVPIRNKRECHECHDPTDTINGVLMFDFNMKTIQAGMDRDLRWMVGGTAGLTLLLIAGIGGVVRFVVLRRLQRFEATARAIAGGDLRRRVPARGSDTISWLAREFNTMADSMIRLLDQVNGQQRRLETVINSIDDGIVVLDPGRNVLAANDAFLRRTGRRREEVLGASCLEVGPNACAPDGCPAVACVTSRERQVRLCERKTPEGAVRWEEVHASPVVAASGELVQVVEVWRDISDRRAAEARLAESHRLASIGLLASGFSHELNTPLATTLMCVEGILRDAQAAGAAPGSAWTQVGQRATTAREQVMRCRSITQQFLRMARGQTSSLDIVDLSDAVRNAARLVDPTARSQAVRIVPPATFAGLHVLADEAELQHVLINLLVNAIQASPPASEVRIEVERGDPMRIRIVDHGCGIAQQHQARIFEPFFSLRDGGTGLGLFLSLNFVRRWGGTITVTSRLGAGSVFEVAIPAASPHAERQTA